MFRKFLLGLGLLLPVVDAVGAPEPAVVRISPPGWSASAAPDTVIAAELDSVLSGTTNFAVNSSWRGKLAGLVTGDGTTNLFTPAAPLLPGEVVESVLSGDSGLAFSWRYQAGSQGGAAAFSTNAISTVMDTAGKARFRNLALADINGDSRLDIVAPAWGSNAVLVAVAPDWASSQTTQARGIQDAVVGDFNADGRPDLLLGCSTQAFAVALNTGSGFAPGSSAQTLSGVSGPLRQVAVADLNCDGLPDGVAISEISGHVIPLLNAGSGALAPGAAVACTFTPYGLDVGDLDRDGIPDVVTVGNAGYLAVLKGNGDGTFQAPAPQTVSGEALYACRIADFNQDGFADIAAVGAAGVVVVGTGSASNFTFEAIDHGFPLTTLYGLAVGDCDANGRPDIVTCGGTSVLVLLARPGGFSASVSPVVIPGELLRDVEIGDLNNDGCLDLAVCGLSSGKTYILWNAPASVPLVRGNGLDIQTGEAANVGKGTDFGVVPVFSSTTNQFQMINRGKGALLINGVGLSGAATSVMRVVGMPLTVVPGGTSVFSIVFAPETTGTVAAVLTITNNSLATVADAASPYIINLAGQSVRSRPRVLSIGGTNHVYDGTAKEALITVDPVNEVSVLYDGQAANPVTAGVYTVVAEVNVELCYGAVTSVLTIARRPLTVTCPDASRTYGEANPGFSLTLTNFVSGEGVTNLISEPVPVCGATNDSPVGNYPMSGTGGAAANYSFNYVSGTLSVTQALLTVKADDASRMLGEADPPFTATITGFKNAEGTNVFTTQPVGATTATLGSPSGTYPITFSGGAALNYAFFYLPGTLTVYGVTAKVAITNLDFTYDGTPKAVTVTTLPSNLTVNVTYNGAETLPVTAGVYSVFAQILGSDYSGSTNATLIIRKAPQAVTAFLPANGVYPADRLLALSASGSPSGIPVTFEVVSGPARLESTNQLRFLGLDAVAVAAWQPEGANWKASPALTNHYSALETNVVHFAALAGQTSLWPYASWETAASNIQTAVDQAAPGEIVRVGAGLYATGGRPAPGAALANRLMIDKAIRVLAENGPAVTFLVGQPGSGVEAPLGADAVRCLFMTNGAVLAGFTLTNGFTAGEARATADQAGGGAFLSSGSVLSNCVIVGCGAVSAGGLRGGSATRCTLSGNLARYEGGGAGEATLSACLVWNNAAPYGGGAYRCEMTGCTLADNTALFGGGTYEGALVNGVVWYNTGYDCFGTVASHVNAGSGVSAGLDGCLVAPPLFVSRPQGNYRLAYGSPCINTGTNSGSPAGALDRDGAARPIHAVVDMGAYEFFGTPGQPVLSALSDIRARQVNVAWQASTDSVRVIDFRIAVSNQTAATPGIETMVPAPALSGAVTGLAPNTVYACRIRQENDYDVGLWSGWQSFTTITEAAIVTATTLTFNVTYAAGHSFTQTVALANAGATPCVWSGAVAYEGTAADWLTVVPAGGTVRAFDSTGVLFVVNAAGLGVGTYTALHTLASPNATNSPKVQVVTLNVARANDVITFGNTNQVYSGTGRAVLATAFSGEAVAVTYNGSATPPVDAGVYAVTGVVDTVNWTAAATTWLTVSRAPQTITGFLPASGDSASTNVLTLGANGGSSGNPVVFSVVSGPAQLLPGEQARFLDYGEVLLAADQAGNANWLPAPTVTNRYRVVPVPGLLHYVARAGQTPVWPYAAWNGAASNIQDAVDAAWDGDAVAVTNGVYQAGGRAAPGGVITNRICVTRAIELYGVNGAASTVVAGAAPGLDSGLDAVRGLYAGTNALIRGFTFTGGRTATTGGQAQDRSGGGVYLAGGAELRHCIVTENSSAVYGGGAFVQQNGRVNNCLLTGNTSDRGAGLCLYAGGEALHCTIASNTASTAAGGAYLPNGGTIGHGIVWGNRAPVGSPQNLLTMSASIVYTCSGDGVTDGVAGCLTSDPMFAPDGFIPESESACVNAGNNAQAAAATDLKGDPRIVSTLDLGAYEYVVTAAAPKNLAISELTGSSVRLHWRPGDIMPVTFYNVEVETLEGANVYSAQFPGTTTSAVAVGLSDSMPYRWRAQASNSQGVSLWTTWKNFVTRGIILKATPAACNVGGGLEVLVEGRGLSQASDIDSVLLGGVSAFILDQGTNWVRVMAHAAPAPGAGDVRVSSPTGGDLVLSNAFTFLEADAPVLLPPSNLTVTSLLARWESLPGAISYRFQASPVSDFSSFLPGYEGSNALVELNQLHVFPLVPGTNYLRMQAWFAEGYGPFSPTVTVKRRLQSLSISETNAVYDGAAKPVGVAVEPSELAASIRVLYNGSGTLPVTAGVYAVYAEVDTADYYGDKAGVLSIAKRELTATGEDASRAYGEANPPLSVKLLNFASGEGTANLTELPVAACAATNNSPVGPYSIAVSGGSAANYTFAWSNGTLTVTQALLTVKADDATWLYGKTNSPFTLTITGWKNGDGTNVFSVQPVASTPATPLSTAGTYPITVAGGAALNYAFDYVPGVLTLNPIEAFVTIGGTNLVYDGNPKPVTVVTDPTNLTVVLTYNGLETEPVTAGVYAVHAEIDERNYYGSTNATLTIRKADQAVVSFRPANGAYPADQLLALSADGSPSGIPVTFAVVSGPGVLVSATELRFLGFGPVAVAAWQASDENWNASPALTNTYEAFETNTVYYVAKAGQTPRWPYVSVETAASNIQTAVDQASAGETVWVGPGLYEDGGRAASGGALINRLVIDKALAVLSVGGPDTTFIAGQPGAGSEAPLGADAVRCVVMTDGAMLAGFTLTNGFTGGELGPAADQLGGGALLSVGSMISNCVITGCGAVSGGGLYGGTAVRCIASGNAALNEGGGAANARLAACLLWNNAAPYGGGAFRCELASCTLADNTALYGGGTYEGALVNGIAWYNTGYDCFATLVSHVNAGSGIAAGVDGSLSAPPMFKDRAGGDYRLAYGSPCINSGANAASPVGALDLDGALRPIHATVDMGAYEFFGTPGVPTLSPPSDIRAHQAVAAWELPLDGVRVIRFRIAVSNLVDGMAGSDTLVEAPALSGVVTGLAPETAYAFRIRSENDYDVGGWSGWQCFTTLTEAVIRTDPALAFTITYAAGHSLTQTVALVNPGATPCDWSGAVSYEGASSGWLTVAPAGGTVEAFGSTGLMFVVTAAGLDAGTHTARHTLSSPNATNSPQVQVVTLTVARAADTIVFGDTNQVYNGTARPVTAVSLSSEPVAVTYNGSATPPVDAGVYAVTGVVDTINWTASASTWLTIARAPQTITGFLPASGDVPSTNRLTVGAIGGGSGNPVVFALVSGPASLLPGNRVQFSDYGDVLVAAAQAGDANWLPAPTVTNTYRIVPVSGLTHYVALGGQAPLWPYAAWNEAASNIQVAVDVALDGDSVAVSNGVYQAGGRTAPGGTITNRICVTRDIELFSVNGPAVTRIVGAEPGTASGFDAVRGLYASGGAVIRGFTITGGHSASVSDLAQDRSGGGVYLTGGAELRLCIVTGNRSSEYGGGAFVRDSGLVNNCLLTENMSDQGAGLCLFAGGEAVQCTVASNTAVTAAGGVYIPDTGTLANCIVWGNRAPPAARQDVWSLGGTVSFTCAGDGVIDGAAGCRIADPLFAPGGYRPEVASPCVNAGDNDEVLAETDLKGDPRVVETVDLGAYEYIVSPAVPVNLAESKAASGSVTLSWLPGDVMPVSLYDLEMETRGAVTVLSESLSGASTSLVATGLSDGTGYRWRIRAVNSQGASGWTDWRLFFTPGYLLSVTPASCNVGGGLEVLIEGQGLGYASNIASVSLCGIEAVILDQGEDWVRVMAPAAPAPGLGDVRVSSPTGGDAVLSNSFAFLAAPAPVLLPPSNLTVTSLLARWESLPGAVSYRFQASPVSDFASFLPGYEGSNALVDLNQLEVFPLVPGTNYLRIQAWFAEGYGPFSPVLTVKQRLQLLTIGETNTLYDGTGKAVSVTVEPSGLAASVTVLYNGSASLPVTAGVYTVYAEVDTASYYGNQAGELEIEKRELTAVGEDASRTYGDANPPLSVKLLNFASGEGTANLTEAPVAACAATNNSPVGPYSIEVSGGSAANYTFAWSNGTLTVTQALLTVKADDATRLYGETNSPFTMTITGWKNGDGTNVFTAQPVAATTAASLSPTGTYPIIVSGGAALNYAFSYEPGVLTVNPVEAFVAIGGTNLVYDGNPKPVTVVTDPTNLTVVLTYNGSESEPVTAGVYAVHAEIDESNYYGSTNATLTISKADQAIVSFRPPNGAYPADQLLELSADGSPSGIPVTFAVVSGPGLLESASELRFLGYGPVMVSARQAADDNWNASPTLTNTYEAVETNTVYYVAKAGQTPRWPYVSVETAASNIQTAVDQASAGETVWVGPGLYEDGGRPAAGAALTNRLVLDKAVTVLSVGGPDVTVIPGRPGTGGEAPLGADAIRCVFMTDGAVLAGFTLTNGFTGGELGPAADQLGGGAFLSPGSVISNCVITGCGAVSGGGLYGGTAVRCIASGNAALNEGGGAANARLAACLLWNNAAPYGGGAFRCDLAACTLADNTALYGGGTYEGALVNGLAWYNTGFDCFGTLVSHVNAGSGIAAGVDGCLSAPPLFSDRAGGDYRLAYGSPCINSGANAASPVGALDLDGALRPIHATVDMGAYEFFGTPGVPLLSEVSDIRAHQAAASWDQPSDGVRVIRFRIAVSNLVNGLAGSDTLVEAPALSGVVTGLAPETAYAFRIRSENDYDVGGWSGWQSFTTLTEAVIVTDPALTFNLTYAAGHSLTQTVALVNPGATPCDWSGAVSYEGASSGWLTVAPAGGTVDAFGSTGLIFVVTATGLDAGVYTARHTLSSPNATNSPQVQVVTLTVARAADTIVFGDTNQVYNGTARPVTAVSLSGEPVAVTYNGSATPPVDAGVYAVTGVVDSLNWTAVLSTRLTIARAPQAITGFLPASGDVPSTNRLTLVATGGGSGNPVVFALVSGPASLLPGNRVRFSDYGEVLMTAAQAGDANWLPAPTVTNTYQIVPVTGLTHYVAQGDQAPLWPYAAWNEAASNIQVAVDVARDGDSVAVSNGVYQTGGRPAPGGTITNRICVTRAITLYSVNGPAVTRVVGAEPGTASGFDAVRGLYASGGAVIRGFTITGGHSASVSDLAQDRSGGGVYLTGGSELRLCIVTGNRSSEYGGGAFVRDSGLVNNCLLTENMSDQGAGLCLFAGGEAVQCTVASNTAGTAAGGVYIPDTGILANCIVWGNRAPPAARQDVWSLGGTVSFTCAGDGVVDGAAGCRIADPLFAPGGYRPEVASPCVNAGDNDEVATETDLKDDPRMIETVDLGAYEYIAIPAEPRDLAESEVAGGSVTLSWQPGDVMPVTRYDLEMETRLAENVLSESLSGASTSLVATGLSDGTGYRWRVRAVNSQGAGGWTDWRLFFTPGYLLSVTPASCNVGGGVEVLIEGQGLGYASNIAVVSLCGVEATILDQGEDWVRVMAPIAPAAGLGDVRVSSPTGGDLVLSNAFTFLEAPAPVLLPPTDITADSLVARWEPLAGAESFQLQVSDGADFAACLPGLEGTNAPAGATRMDVLGLVPGTNYLRLRARFAEGYGPFCAPFAVPSGAEQPWVRETIADVLATAGETRTYDLSTVFAGAGLDFSASSSEPGIGSPLVSGNTLTLTIGPGQGEAIIQVTAMQAGSGYSVSTAFRLEVMPAPLGALRINCGGKKKDGWLRDRGYSGGVSVATKAAIEMPTKDFPMAVYQDCRVASNLTYSFPELPNGSYYVRLAFAELEKDRIGDRLFKVKIEGRTVLPYLDVLMMTGMKFRAFKPLFKVVVSDGNGLQIRGIGLNGSEAFFSGITVLPSAPVGMLVIPAGVNTGVDPDTGPYSVTNKAKLFVDGTEVSKQLWDEVRAWGLTHGYTDLAEGSGKAPDHPVQMVSWYDCVKWCNARSQMQGLQPAYYTTPAKDEVYTNGLIDLEADCVDVWAGYRLPTGGEWEYAARGGSVGQRFPWGDSIDHLFANYVCDPTYAYDAGLTAGFHPDANDGIAPYTLPAGSFSAFGYKSGLHNMAGNVAEWCWDQDAATGTNRLMRGGAWSSDAAGCRVSQSQPENPALRADDAGFRSVMARP